MTLKKWVVVFKYIRECAKYKKSTGVWQEM